MRHIRFILLLFVIIQLSGCEKLGLNIDPPESVSGVFMGKTETSITYRLILAIEKDNIKSYGVCWSRESLPTSDDNSIEMKPDKSENLSIKMTGLEVYTKYFIRPFATNRAGTTYGEEFVCWTQPNDGTEITDVDGTIYHTIKIGNQVWFVENLKTTRFRNGDLANYLSYKNDTQLSDAYGFLYPYEVVHDQRGITPIGWHIPIENDWSILIDYLGGWDDDAQVAQKLKEEGTLHWDEENIGSTNESGFTALGGGYYGGGRFDNLKEKGWWWIFDASYALTILSSNQYSNLLFISGYSSAYYSIRCIQD